MGKIINWKTHHGYINIAKELGYSDKVIQQLKDAKTERQCEHILTTARLRKIKEEEE